MIGKKDHSILFFSICLTSIFFLLSLCGILHHELWIDEAHSFLIARESPQLIDLYHNARQEGHPLVWYIILWGIHAFSQDVLYMQIVHILISSVTVFFMAYWAPFNKIKKILFAFSYYFFFEYNIISRNYSLCLLFVTLYLILVLRTHKNFLALAIVLALLANTHFLGLIFSVLLMLATGMIWWRSSDQLSQTLKPLIIPFLILFTSYCVCILYVMPEEASMFSKFERNGYLSFKRLSACTIILKGLFQFPYVDNTSWNTNIFTANKGIGFLLTIIVSVVSVKAFINRPLSLFIFWSTVLTFSLFFYLELMHVYAVRHWGFVFIGFYATIWFAEGLDQRRFLRILNSLQIPTFLTRNSTKWREIFLYTVLFVQVSASIYMYMWDYYNPFCNAKAVAGYIKENKLDKELIIVSNYSSGIALNAYVGKNKFYYPEYHGFGTYGVWSIWPNTIGSQELLHEIETCKKLTKNDTALLVLNDLMYADPTLTFTDSLNFNIKYLTGFDKSYDAQDKYQLFLVTYK